MAIADPSFTSKADARSPSGADTSHSGLNLHLQLEHGFFAYRTTKRGWCNICMCHRATQIYLGFTETVKFFFGPSSVLTTEQQKSMQGNYTGNYKAGELTSSKRSFKLVTECPVIVMFLFQVNRACVSYRECLFRNLLSPDIARYFYSFIVFLSSACVRCY